MIKKLISNLPPLVNSWFGENYHFNGVARYVMGCLGEMKLADYSLFSGITGDTFTQFYSLTRILGDSPSDYYLGLRKLTNAFDLVGYAAESFSERELQADKECYMKKIVSSIDRGVPVIWYHPHIAAIVGYEDDGNTLLYIRSDKTEPERLRLISDFFNDEQSEKLMDICGFIIVGEKKTDVSLKQIYREAIMRLPKLLTTKTADYVFGAEAFRAWANDIENGKYDEMKPEDFNGDFFAYEVYVVNLATNSGGCQAFLEKAQEMNPDFTFLEEVRKQYRITNYLWNGGHWVKDVHSAKEREELIQLYGESTLDMLGGAFECKLETLQDKEKRALIAKQLIRFADCIDNVVRILNENLINS